MGNCICGTDESTLETPFGKCSIKHCSCFRGRKKRAMPEEIQVRAELALVAHLLKKKMTDGPVDISVQEHGNQITIVVNALQSAAIPPEKESTDEPIAVVPAEAAQEPVPPGQAPRRRRLPRSAAVENLSQL